MSIYKTTPDLAVRKSIGVFQAALTLASGVANWDYGDTTTEETNSPNRSYTGVTPFLINLIENDSEPYFTKITLYSLIIWLVINYCKSLINNP